MKLECETWYARARPELSPVCVHKENLWCKTRREPWYTHRPIRMRHDRNRNRQLSMLIVNIETDAQTEVKPRKGGKSLRSSSHDDWIMTAMSKSKGNARARIKARATNNMKLRED